MAEGSIKTDYRPKPVPFRGWDWTAWREEGGGAPVGYGDTKTDAVLDLLRKEQDEADDMAAQERHDAEQHYIEHGPGRR